MRQSSNILWAILLWNLNEWKPSGIFTKEKVVVGGLELAIKDIKKNKPSVYIVLYLGNGKGEGYSYLPFEKCFRRPCIHSFASVLSGFVLLLIGF